MLESCFRLSIVVVYYLLITASAVIHFSAQRNLQNKFSFYIISQNYHLYSDGYFLEEKRLGFSRRNFPVFLFEVKLEKLFFQ